MIDQTEALGLLRTAMGSQDAGFREGQWEAIDAIVNRRSRVLCIQRTGWGKSMVYFIAAKLLRVRRNGVTLIVSPLLSLMRNQLEAAARLGLCAETINSTNTAEWDHIRGRLLVNEVDLLLISPERLANDDFVQEVLQPIAARIALLVVDEAHCISDWGHDFRPDYRRIGQILGYLPDNISVLATTATANRRVQVDVATQLGGNTEVQRSGLIRESLSLDVLRLPGPADRLAWLAAAIRSLPGSGIVYTLTKRDADRVADWLVQNGIDARAYYAGDEHMDLVGLENQLLNNQLKCLVATTALGMGYDKPDLTFVIHYQTPGNVVSYYQQVGRAGRAIDSAYGFLLSGNEDGEINAYFRENAFPHDWQVESVLDGLQAAADGLTVREIEQAVNLPQKQIEKVLKLLAVEPSPPVFRQRSTWTRTANPFRLDRARIDHLTRQREGEWAQMQDYLAGRVCLMSFLAAALDDPHAAACGKCAVCLGHPVHPVAVDSALLIDAKRFIRYSEIPLVLKKQWEIDALPVYMAAFECTRANIPEHLRGERGFILSRWGEPIWGALVAQGKALGRFDDVLVEAAVDLIRHRWPDVQCIGCVVAIPSRRHPELLPDFARRLALALHVPFGHLMEKIRETESQKDMENRFHQCHNLDGAFRVNAPEGLEGAVLLVDDVVDSAWTLTIAAALLRQAGAAAVYPFALATSSTT